MTPELPIGIWLACHGKTYTLHCLVSREDYDYAVARGNWFVTHANGDGRRCQGPGYAVRSEGGVLQFLHKHILERAVGPAPSPKHTLGDHKNGHKLDNRRGNLRWATHQQNARNTHGSYTRQYELAL